MVMTGIGKAREIALKALNDPSSCSPTEVAAMARYLLDSRRHDASPYRAENLDKASQLRRADYSFQQIADEIGEGDKSGWFIALKRVGERGPLDSRKKWTPEEQATIAKLYRMGTTAKDIADRFGTTDKSVSGQLYRMGIKRR